MPIGVKETQEIIRQAAVLSRNEPAVPAKLEPTEVGMATGPRHRKRALMRTASVPDYLDPSELPNDEWQKLDDDIYKFLHLRKDQFGRMDTHPSHQFIAEMEAQLKSADPGYELGTYLGLLRQAADLDQTRQTYVTASEKGTFHAFARRIGEGRKPGESFDPGMVKRYRELLESNHPTTNRGLADLFRLVARAARMPLIGNLNDAPALCIGVILEVVDIAVRFNQRSIGRLEFQVGPMDVFLGARTVLFNRSVANPTLSMVKELVLDVSGLYHEDLIELLQNIGVFGSELTLLMPETLTEEGFALRGARYSATELVMAAGARLAKVEGPIDRALTTLADAMVHKVQQQDGHKDRQIRSILEHFNHLLKGERRSAARVLEDRQQARFDYMSAIRRAGELAKGMQTGEFLALAPGGQEAEPALAPRSSPDLLEAARFDAGDQALAFRSLAPASPSLADAPPRLPTAPFEDGPVETTPPERTAVAEIVLGKPALGNAVIGKPAVGNSQLGEPALPAAVVVGQISSREYETLLGDWETLLGRVRKKLTTRSPIFKTLAAQLAKVRALDTCMAYGLTPAGGRAASRLARLLQGEGMHIRLGLPPGLAEALEDAFSLDGPGFLASLEALIVTIYGFRPVLPEVQFRLRDRLPAARPGMVDMRPRSSAGFSDGRETTLWADAAEIDEVALRLIMGAIQLAMELSGTRMAAQEPPRFGEDGKLAYAGAAPALGNSDPFLAYCALLWRAKSSAPGVPAPGFPSADFLDDLEAHLLRLLHLTPEDKLALKAKYMVWLGADGKPSPLIPGLGDTRPREGWGRGFERGYMAEMQRIFDTAPPAELERRLLELLSGIQADIDKACGSLEGEKMRLIRDRVMRVVD
ncbi:MAG: hypothetical protein JF616_09015 [Fibrobacteres bacterium]|nr:hypothetical protein [Fibrobacterota bacterium]